MIRVTSILPIYFILFLIIGCGARNEEIKIEDSKQIIQNKEEEIKYHSHDNEFYPLKESMEDLQYQINLLKAQVHEYESSLHAPALNPELLKLITNPHIEHELLMENGTIIQGKIITEDADQMIVQTQIGQLKIDKTLVTSVKNVDPLIPKVIFKDGSIEEKISSSNLTFSGEVINEGGRRADFIRVIYQLWQSETQLFVADSIFVSGNEILYNNNVQSNSSLDPGNIGTFILSIDIPDSIKVSYWTKDIKFDIFE